MARTSRGVNNSPTATGRVTRPKPRSRSRQRRARERAGATSTFRAGTQALQAELQRFCRAGNGASEAPAAAMSQEAVLSQ